MSLKSPTLVTTTLRFLADGGWARSPITLVYPNQMPYSLLVEPKQLRRQERGDRLWACHRIPIQPPMNNNW
ncbi:MAG: hypothetical protein AB4352_07285 [Hormoscilla sp.]